MPKATPESIIMRELLKKMEKLDKDMKKYNNRDASEHKEILDRLSKTDKMLKS